MTNERRDEHVIIRNVCLDTVARLVHAGMSEEAAISEVKQYLAWISDAADLAR